MATKSEFTVEDHFAGKNPQLRKIYDKLTSSIRKFGALSEEPKKTSIHLVNKSALAGVAVRNEYILLNIKSAEPILSPRVLRAEKLSAKRFHQEVKLASPKDIDKELLGWLKTAYALSG